MFSLLHGQKTYFLQFELPIKMNRYQYRPLANEDWMRIIALAPSLDHSATLRCQLHHEDRKSSHKIPKHYEAVSYVWGKNPIFSHTLVCLHEQLGEQSLPITPQVDEVLRNLRKPLGTRRLWIDAICLNQSDDAEKASQVPLMARIYRGARKTHICLASTSTVPLALSKLGVLALRPNNPISEFETAVQEEFVRIAMSVLQDPWFTRRWVLQEAVLSRNSVVRRHDDSVSWSSFIKGVSYCLEYANPPLRSDISIYFASRVIEMLSKDIFSNVFDLLENVDASECTDPRDRLYSLLGLLSRTTELPAVDYNSHYSYVFSQLAVYASRSSASEYLSFVSNLQQFDSLWHEEANFPSWVPAWSRRRRRSLHTLPAIGPQAPLNARTQYPISIWTTQSSFVVRKILGSCADLKSIMFNLHEFVVGYRSRYCSHFAGVKLLQDPMQQVLADVLHRLMRGTLDVALLCSALHQYFEDIQFDARDISSILDRLYQAEGISPPQTHRLNWEHLEGWNAKTQNSMVALCTDDDPFHPYHGAHLALVPASSTEGCYIACIAPNHTAEFFPAVLREEFTVNLSKALIADFSDPDRHETSESSVRQGTRYRLLGKAYSYHRPRAMKWGHVVLV